MQPRQNSQFDQSSTFSQDLGATRAVFVLEPGGCHGLLTAEHDHVPDILQSSVRGAVLGNMVTAVQVDEVEACYGSSF